MTEPAHTVFLSYASQDAEAAQKICEALRAAGIEVWFDQSELRGGDAWDQSIRKQIKTCGQNGRSGHSWRAFQDRMQSCVGAVPSYRTTLVPSA